MLVPVFRKNFWWFRVRLPYQGPPIAIRSCCKWLTHYPWLILFPAPASFSSTTHLVLDSQHRVSLKIAIVPLDFLTGHLSPAVAVRFSSALLYPSFSNYHSFSLLFHRRLSSLSPISLAFQISPLHWSSASLFLLPLFPYLSLIFLRRPFPSLSLWRSLLPLFNVSYAVGDWSP